MFIFKFCYAVLCSGSHHVKDLVFHCSFVNLCTFASYETPHNSINRLLSNNKSLVEFIRSRFIFYIQKPHTRNNKVKQIFNLFNIIMLILLIIIYKRSLNKSLHKSQSQNVSFRNKAYRKKRTKLKSLSLREKMAK